MTRDMFELNLANAHHYARAAQSRTLPHSDCADVVVERPSVPCTCANTCNKHKHEQLHSSRASQYGTILATFTRTYHSAASPINISCRHWYPAGHSGDDDSRQVPLRCHSGYLHGQRNARARRNARTRSDWATSN